MQQNKTTVIEAHKTLSILNFSELYQFRELLWTLTYRDFRAKYAQTILGFIWAFINPLFTLVILSFVFGTVAKVDTGGIPHAIYTIAGMCGWTYFSKVFEQAGSSIIGAQNMVKKIYFPRIIIPASKALTALIDFGIVLLCLVILMVYYQFPPASTIVYMPLFIIVAIVSGLTAGIWMSALTIRFRDFQHITPLLVRIGMYATPIAYPASAVPEKYQMLFYMNPMAGVVEGMRWSIVGGVPPNGYAYISFALIFILFFVGLFYFSKVERIMADIL